ncbi:MAG: Gfo/Idh/MocA family oxidoreductase [Terracidiphilus sp.]
MSAPSWFENERSRTQERGNEITGERQLRVAVAGAGAFGRNHLRVVRELEAAGEGVALTAAVEPDAARAEEAAKQYGIRVFASIDELLKADLKLDAACVAVPTVKHHETAAALLEAGLDLLVEKPLAANLAEADDLIERAERRGRIVQPGHLERFNPAVLAVEPRLKRPMFFEAHRLSVFTPRALDVDVVLDLMIHDLDIVLTFARSAVREVRAVGLPIVSPKVDIANVRVEFETGCVANFTASRVSTERVRKLRFFEPREYVSIDYARRDVLVIQMDESGVSGVGDRHRYPPLPQEQKRGKDGAPNSSVQLAQAAAEFLATGKLDRAAIEKLMASGQIPATVAMKIVAAKNDPEKLKEIAKGLAGPQDGPAPGLRFVRPEVTPGEPLRLEILSFLESVRTRRTPKVTARQGRAALELALAIQAAMAAHAERAGLGDFFKS